MIKKLKIKFIITNMSLIITVVALAFALLYYNSARELKNDSITAMKDIAHSQHDPLNDLFDKNKDDRSKYQHFVTYTLDIDTRTNTCYIDGFGDAENLTEDNITYINSLINAVHSSLESEGVLEEYNMRYYRTEIGYCERIVLLDKQFEDDSLTNLLVSFIISGLIAFIAFLIISIIIAKIAVKPIDKSMKLQKQLISDISHELKTPITVISTNTDIVLSHSESTVANEHKWLGYIKDETKRISDLINMMLYLAKTDETDSEKTELKLFDFSNAAFEVSLPFESVCFEKGKTFDYNIEPDIFICGDEISIKQLLVILLDNAVKYSNENGKIELNLRIHNDKAMVSVFNSGAPIPKESIPFIFDRFYRVDEARSRESGGSGLGLSIAKRIIEKNEGYISVTSNEEHGTIFMCNFKLNKTRNKDKKDSEISFI